MNPMSTSKAKRTNGASAPQPPAQQPQPQQVQINPADVARAALGFMQRVQFTAAERRTFDMVESLLSAIVEGQAILSAPPAAAPEEISPAPDSTQ
jgi:hypothetical protein